VTGKKRVPNTSPQKQRSLALDCVCVFFVSIEKEQEFKSGYKKSWFSSFSFNKSMVVTLKSGKKKKINRYFFLWKKYEKNMNSIFGDL